MGEPPSSLPVFACLAAGAAWTVWLARCAPRWRLRAASAGGLGGLSAYAVAWLGYELLERAGVPISWDAVLAGGAGAAASAAAIGLVEEGGKLAGVLLAFKVMQGAGPRRPLRCVLAVAAVFAALESATLAGEVGAGALLARALLAPVAHAALSAPLSIAVAGPAFTLRRAVPALLLSATLHGLCDLSLAIPALGRTGYAVVLAAPPVFLYLQARLGGGRREARAT